MFKFAIVQLVDNVDSITALSNQKIVFPTFTAYYGVSQPLSTCAFRISTRPVRAVFGCCLCFASYFRVAGGCGVAGTDFAGVAGVCGSVFFSNNPRT